jgi:hypothetical protein
VVGYSDQYLSLSEFFEIMEKLIHFSGDFYCIIEACPLTKTEVEIYLKPESFKDWLFIVSKAKIF